jgi:hypothetical protein
MRLLILLFFIPILSYGQNNADVLYEKALFEIRNSNKPAFVSDIQFKSELSELEKIEITNTYLKKEDVFKVEFLSEEKLRLFFFEPVSYEIIEDLARMYFTEFFVTKPIRVEVRNGGLFLIE